MGKKKTEPMGWMPRLRVYASADMVALSKACKDITGELLDMSGQASGRSQSFQNADKLASFVYVSKDCGLDPYIIATHEAVHVVDDYMTMIGEDSCGSEIRAYMTESVVRCIMAQIGD